MHSLEARLFEFLNTLSDYEGVVDSALNIKLVRAALQALVRYAALMVLCMYVSILVLASVSLLVYVVHEPVQCTSCMSFSCLSLLGSLNRAGALLLSLSCSLMRSVAHYRSRTRSCSPPFSLARLRALSLRMGTLKSSKQTNPTARGEARYFIPDTEVL